MSDGGFTEITSDSWFSRLGNAIKNVLLGLILFIVSFPLLWWNEGRAVQVANGLKELGQVVQSPPIDRVDPKFDKKPVHLSGKATTADKLTDGQFSLSVPAIKLARRVEMYQWQEVKESTTRKKLGGGSETTTTYNYRKEWSKKPIDSNGFHSDAAKSHRNPEHMRLEGMEKTADTVRLGDFRLSPGLVQQMNDFQRLPFSPEQVKRLPPPLSDQVKLSDDVLYLAADADKKAVDPAAPEIGDLKIYFEVVKPAEVSVIARQVADTFEPWRSRTGTTIERLMMGVRSPKKWWA